MEFRIRECDEPADAIEIHRLITALAEYEREPAAMTASVEDMRRDGFERSPPLFGAVLAEYKSKNEQPWKAVGVAFYITSYSSWKGKCLYLEDIFVEPEWRGKGLGSRLMKHAVSAALSTGCARLQWIVLDWNKSSIDFYKSCGARELPEWKLMRFDKADMERFIAQR